MSLRGRYCPVDPVAYGSPDVCPNETTGVSSAVYGDNSDLMKMVAELWIQPSDVIADVTYGRGVFWRKLPDLVVKSTDLSTGTDLRDLPYDSNSVDVLVIDPPYRPLHSDDKGIDFGIDNSYRFHTNRLASINDVLDLYRDGMTEAARVVRPGGVVMAKCQDLTYNHRLHLVHLDVLRRMVTAGFDLVDMFVLLNKTRMPHRTVRQERARRAHSYLMVGKKPS